MTAIVFAGPSLPAADRAGFADVDFRPPVRQGDVWRAVADGPAAIGIIDGYFEGVPSVWHKEILFALSKGIPVSGAASMGALRAAELDSYGMIGVGAIYEAYRDGIHEDDDEVAVLHGPTETGHVAVTVPMVNVRATLDRLAGEGQLSAADAAAIAARAKAIHYKDRDWPAVAAGDSALWDLLRANAVDLKRADALELMAALAKGLQPPDPDAFAFAEAFTFRTATAVWAGDVVGEDDRLVLEQLLVEPDLLADLSAIARLRRALLTRPAPSRPDRNGVRAALDEFRRRHGLMTRAALETWLEREGIAPQALEAGLESEARARASEAAAGPLTQHLVAVIAEHGHYRRLLSAARKREEALAAEPPPPDPPPPVLLDWYARIGGDPVTENLVDDLGYADIGAFCHSLARHWHYARLPEV